MIRPVTSHTITYHSITTLHDPYLEGYLDRFQDDFPPDEQMYVSDFIRALKEREKAQNSPIIPKGGLTLLCALQESQMPEDAAESLTTDDIKTDGLTIVSGETPQKVVGMACYEIDADNGVVYLWYLSVDPGVRSAGIGSGFYQEIVQRVRVEAPEAHYFFYEIERPDQAHTPEQRTNAERRIAFYQRNGGHVFREINYWQRVRKEPRVQMYLVGHALKSTAQPESELGSKEIGSKEIGSKEIGIKMEEAIRRAFASSIGD